jgi:UPF0271 protein
LDQPGNNNSNESSKASSGERALDGAAIDLNCDMGEGISNDEMIMPFISSANIACGYHAGDAKTIWQTIELALKYKCAVGAHVSFLDRENFGRKEMSLDIAEVYDLVIQQLIIIKEIADSFNIKLNHIKPHGALYNMSANEKPVANTIARAARDFDESLILFGLSGSHSIKEAKAIGIKTVSEVFADRSYQDDGSLTPRLQPNALVEDTGTAIERVLQMIREGTVTAVSGKQIPITAETICIHGDGIYAAEFAEKIYTNLKQNNIDIKAL